ncbi:sperm flagellar protein 1-like [Drosophila pseudoobscura]|uniref:Sperm flagellar protein 1-like n=1 Tax=Drosophila pseudoobscura pseudoobscura TaxID=46245 RepID=A0A6I8VM28_DROPS|nr:sperm flagellar protein 1 [Drosophila pseudoobscura]
MSHIRELNSCESRDLHLWLQEQRIDLNAKKRVKFSDVLPVATIAQTVYPRLVDLIHYTPSRHSVANKLQNWKVFNFTVLKKLNITLSELYMKELAQGQEGAIELLFYELFVRPLKIASEEDRDYTTGNPDQIKTSFGSEYGSKTTRE